MATEVFVHEGISHPLLEAEYDTAFTVYKTDAKKAVIGDPEFCIEALGLRRIPNVEFAHVSSGRHGFVGFKDKSSPTGVTVRHFIIASKPAEVRDLFETRKPVKSQVLLLRAPANSETRAYLRNLQRRRREEIKAGAEVVTRGPQKHTRMSRLGIGHRRQPKIVKVK